MVYIQSLRKFMQAGKCNFSTYQRCLLMFFMRYDSGAAPFIKNYVDVFRKLSSLRLNTPLWQQVEMPPLALFLLHF